MVQKKSQWQLGSQGGPESEDEDRVKDGAENWIARYRGWISEADKDRFSMQSCRVNVVKGKECISTSRAKAVISLYKRRVDAVEQCVEVQRLGYKGQLCELIVSVVKPQSTACNRVP